MPRACLAVLAAALMLLVPAGAPAGAADSPAPAPDRPVYLALGDSVAAGQQSVPPTGDYVETVAAWKANGYAGQLAEVLVAHLPCAGPPYGSAGGCPGLQYVNIARTAVPEGVPGLEPRPGVTAGSLLEEQLPVATALLRARNGDRDPRNDVRVVTLTVGGNDVFAPVVDACVTGPARTLRGCVVTVDAALRSVARNYARILAELRAAAGPDTVIATMTYPNPIRSCFLGRPPYSAAPLADVVLELFPVRVDGGVALGLNGVVRQLSARHGAVVADTYGRLDAPEDFVGGPDCLHPDASGHRELTAAFVAALRSAR